MTFCGLKYMKDGVRHRVKNKSRVTTKNVFLTLQAKNFLGFTYYDS